MKEPDEAGQFPDMSLGQLFAAHAQAHDRQHMHHEAFMSAVFALIEGLDNSDLKTLRSLLSIERDSVPMSFFDGLIVGYMRWQRGLDPDTGRTLDEQAADALAQSFKGQAPPAP